MKWIVVAALAGLLAAGCSTNKGGSSDTFDNEGRYKSWGYPPAEDSGGASADWEGGMVDDIGQ